MSKRRRAPHPRAPDHVTLILVGHQVNITDITGIAPGSGAAVAVRADPQGCIEVLETISPSVSVG